ncbi:MAG: tetratricopeptide repeat protein [Pirellulales bacterium]
MQQCFEHGCKSAASNNFDYAADMFDICVKGDPSNGIYVKQYLANLGKKYNDNKKGAGFTSAPRIKVLQGIVKKSQYSKDWTGILEKGWDVLKLNPWDVATLGAMADAAAELHFDEAQLIYLKQALDVNPKDAEVNRKCGKALAALGHFDQAITCWHRVEQAKPGDDEAARAVADLAIERTITKGGYEDAESGSDVRADKSKLEELTEHESKFTPVQRLERAIAKKPDDVGLYLELSDLHTREERFKEAEDVLRKALEASGGEMMVRERLEDAHLRAARRQLDVAKAKANKEKTPEAVALYKKMKSELNSAELDVYRSRSERYPNNLRHKFELALRLKKAGEIQEAIKQFQAASGEPKNKGKVHLELGECFQAIKQYKLAMQNYEASLEAFSTREADERKWALYLAGRLSQALAEKHLAEGDPQGKGELDQAERHLNELASLEYGYKDVPQLLDRITKIRHKG